MFLETIFEWVGAISGISGAALVASHTRYAPYGWLSFLVSSTCMSCYAFIKTAPRNPFLQMGEERSAASPQGLYIHTA